MISYGKALDIVAERTYYNARDIDRKNKQRRNQVVDIYGYEFTRFGDGGAPATFYISVSPDMVYLERFQFKLIVSPFVMTTGSGSATQSQTVSVNNTSLSVSNNNISPNPHSHSTVAHSHNLTAGIALVNTDADDFTVTIDGVDVTAYLMAQYDGQWISGEGIYPDDTLNAYDILEVASDLTAEGETEKANKLLQPGYKVVEIASNKPFQATMALYLKYSHLNR